MVHESHIDTDYDSNGIMGYSDPTGSAEIHRHGGGVFRIIESSAKLGELMDTAALLASALAAWRIQTKAKILSVAGIGSDYEGGQVLIVITEHEQKE